MKQKEKKIFTLSEMLGVDLGLSARKISPKRASYMKNLISDGGINHKRHGWEEIASFCDSDGKALCINGIHEYKKAGSAAEFIVHAGCEMFRCSKDFSKCEKLTVNDAEIIDAKSMSFETDGKLWIIGCGDFLVYDSNSLRRVYNSGDAYVPTTAKGIKKKGGGERENESFEDINLLTPRRKNTMCGEGAVFNGSYCSYCDFNTDSAVNLEKPIKMTAAVDLEKTGYTASRGSEKTLNTEDIRYVDIDAEKIESLFGTDNASPWSMEVSGVEIFTVFKEKIRITSADFYAPNGYSVPRMQFSLNGAVIYDTESSASVSSGKLSLTDKLKGLVADGMSIYSGGAQCALKGIMISGKPAFSDTVYISFSCGAIEDNSTVYCTVQDASGEDITLYSSGKIEFSPSLVIRSGKQSGKGLLMFGFDTSPPPDNPENIVFEYEPCDCDFGGIIGGCSFGSVFTDASGSCELILSGNEARRNAAYFSKNSSVSGNYGYFPAENRIFVGSDREPVCALLRLADSSMGIFKEKGFYRIEFSGNKDTSSTTLYEYQSADNCGCVNPYTAKNVNSDSLVLNASGVCGVDTGSALSAVSRCMRIRSSNINKALLQFSESALKNAVACEYRGRYYLFMNDKDGTVYIGDTRYKNYEDARLDSSFEYEWWVFKNCFAVCAPVYDGIMYLGRADGRICVFSDTYTDKMYIKAKTNDVSCDYTNSVVTINSALGAKAGDCVCVGKHFRFLSDIVLYDAVTGKVTLSESGFFKTENGLKSVNIFDGDRVKISYSQNGETFFSEGVYEISDTDAEQCTFYLKGTPLPDTASAVYKQSEGAEYILRNAGAYAETSTGTEADGDTGTISNSDTGTNTSPSTEGDTGTISNSDTGTDEGTDEGEFLLYDGETQVKLGNTQEAFSLSLVHKEIVKAEYVTPVFDFGTHIKTKNLHAISLSAASESGKTVFGYETRKNLGGATFEANGGMDFSNTDFRSFSLDCAFETGRTVRLFERGFNYIKFRFSSETDADMAPSSFSAVYTINDKITLGVR